MMTNETILQKAIEKAVRNGWVPEEMKKGTVADGARYIVRMKPESRLMAILLSHDFAKCFFGEEEYRELTHKEEKRFEKLINEAKMSAAANQKIQMLNEMIIQTMKVSKGWRWHLQQMVVSEDPIKYLESYL